MHVVLRCTVLRVVVPVSLLHNPHVCRLQSASVHFAHYCYNSCALTIFANENLRYHMCSACVCVCVCCRFWLTSCTPRLLNSSSYDCAYTPVNAMLYKNTPKCNATRRALRKCSTVIAISIQDDVGCWLLVRSLPRMKFAI